MALAIGVLASGPSSMEQLQRNKAGVFSEKLIQLCQPFCNYGWLRNAMLSGGLALMAAGEASLASAAGEAWR